jgi:Flp pilus assembly protein TadG
MAQRTIAIILILVVVAIGAHDAWRYASAQQQLRDTTYELARWAAENASTLSRDQAAVQLAAMGAKDGITVYQYGQSPQKIEIWTETEVASTIVIATVANMIAGKPFSEATSAPFMIRDYREAGI